MNDELMAHSQESTETELLVFVQGCALLCLHTVSPPWGCLRLGLEGLLCGLLWLFQ